MRIDYLRYFKRLAEVGSYTKAAKDLFIAQPTLSIAIKRMEEQLGFPLFNRNNKSGLELTESGKVFYEFASRAIVDYETGIRLAKEKQGEISDSLNLGTIYAMQGKFFSRALDEFGRTCSPDLKIHIKQGFSRELIALLKRGELDVCFCSRIEGVSGLNFDPCWSQHLVLGVNKNSKLASRTSIAPEELRGMEILSYSTQSPVTPEVDEVAQRYGLQVYYGYDDEVALASLVSRNEQSVALFVDSFLVAAFEDVVCIPIENISSDFHHTYLVSRKETHSQIVKDFIDFMNGYRFPSTFEKGEAES